MVRARLFRIVPWDVRIYYSSIKRLHVDGFDYRRREKDEALFTHYVQVPVFVNSPVKVYLCINVHGRVDRKNGSRSIASLN